MSTADRIACRVKCQPLLKEARAIIMGRSEWFAVVSNPDPCDPPDLEWKNGGLVFCGLLVIQDWSESKLAFVVDIPRL